MSGFYSKLKAAMPSNGVRVMLAALALAMAAPSAFLANAQQSKAPGTRAEENCINGRDDDGDGRIDCSDSECRLKAVCTAPIENCANGRDDDRDGKIDCDDSDCAGVSFCVAPVELCTNGKDDDRDGLADCKDSDCAGTSWCSSADPIENCSNGKDDDGDGRSDCADIDCAAAIGCVASCQAAPLPALVGPGKKLLAPSRTLEPLQKK